MNEQEEIFKGILFCILQCTKQLECHICMNLNHNNNDIIHTIIYIFCKCVNPKRCGHVILFIPDVISDHLFSAAPPGPVISAVAPVV